MYDDQGKLTRAGAVAVIQDGGSVSIGKKVYGTVDSLPSEAAFAKGDAKAEADARERLQQTIANAQAQLESLPSDPVNTIEGGDGLDNLSIPQLKERVDAAGLKAYGPHTKANFLRVLRQAAVPEEAPAMA